jgi:hypothetical protein
LLARHEQVKGRYHLPGRLGNPYFGKGTGQNNLLADKPEPERPQYPEIAVSLLTAMMRNIPKRPKSASVGSRNVKPRIGKLAIAANTATGPTLIANMLVKIDMARTTLATMNILSETTWFNTVFIMADPTVVKTPRPPLNRRKTDQLCPQMT